MSCNEQEVGTLTLPSAALLPLRKALIQAVNAERAKSFDAAVALHAHLQQCVADPQGGPAKKPQLDALKAVLREAKRAKRHPDIPVQNFLMGLFDTLDGSLDDRQRRWNSPNPRWSWDHRQDAIQAVYPYAGPDKPRKLMAPKKKDFAPLPSNTLSFHFGGEASIVIDPKTRTVRWHVDRSNHAVDRAWEHPIGQAFAQALRSITWTRATGGVFRYSNEYQEEANLEHGGETSISRSFGPLGEQAEADRMRLPRGLSFSRRRPG